MSEKFELGSVNTSQKFKSKCLFISLAHDMKFIVEEERKNKIKLMQNNKETSNSISNSNTITTEFTTYLDFIIQFSFQNKKQIELFILEKERQEENFLNSINCNKNKNSFSLFLENIELNLKLTIEKIMKGKLESNKTNEEKQNLKSLVSNLSLAKKEYCSIVKIISSKEKERKFNLKFFNENDLKEIQKEINSFKFENMKENKEDENLNDKELIESITKLFERILQEKGTN